MFVALTCATADDRAPGTSQIAIFTHFHRYNLWWQAWHQSQSPGHPSVFLPVSSLTARACLNHPQFRAMAKWERFLRTRTNPLARPLSPAQRQQLTQQTTTTTTATVSHAITLLPPIATAATIPPARAPTSPHGFNATDQPGSASVGLEHEGQQSTGFCGWLWAGIVQCCDTVLRWFLGNLSLGSYAALRWAGSLVVALPVVYASHICMRSV